MKRIILAMLLAVTALQYGLSQTAGSSFTIKGTVVDSLTSEGEPYATVRLTKPGKLAEAVKWPLRTRPDDLPSQPLPKANTC